MKFEKKNLILMIFFCNKVQGDNKVFISKREMKTKIFKINALLKNMK